MITCRICAGVLPAHNPPGRKQFNTTPLVAAADMLVPPGK
jgi:hypothetical protein